MKPTLIGYGPTNAYAVIFWIKDHDAVSYTSCFNEQDVQDMFEKFATPGGLYNSFDGYEIEYLHNKSCKVVKQHA